MNELELSPREAVEYYLARIEANSFLNAFISIREEALDEADHVPEGPLTGLMIGVKDVIDVAGTPTTAASKILADNVPTRDATVVARLREAGALIIGKTNTHEFAYGATTTSPHFGPARNPWDTTRICGGSSGGSGAAAAAGLADGTLGTDTGGSIRIPAAFCGVAGIRPTIGLVPNDGVVPTAWTFDVVGPIARTVEACALLLEVISATPMPLEPRTGLRIGLVTRLFRRADPRIAELAEEAVRDLGTPVEVDPPLLEEAGVIQQLMMLPEASAAHLPWLRTRLADYGADVRARLLAGLFLPGTAYATGLRARKWYLRELLPFLAGFDLLAAPAMPMLPPLITDDALPYRRALIPYNSPWSLAGLPVATVPTGLVDGLPASLALIGAPGEDAAVLSAAHAIDSTRGELVYKRQSAQEGV